MKVYKVDVSGIKDSLVKPLYKDGVYVKDNVFGEEVFWFVGESLKIVEQYYIAVTDYTEELIFYTECENGIVIDGDELEFSDEYITKVNVDSYRVLADRGVVVGNLMQLDLDDLRCDIDCSALEECIGELIPATNWIEDVIVDSGKVYIHFGEEVALCISDIVCKLKNEY